MSYDFNSDRQHVTKRVTRMLDEERDQVRIALHSERRTMQRQELLRRLWQLDQQAKSLDARDLVEFSDARRR